MPNSPDGKTIYFDVRSAWVLNKFTPEEIALFFKEGAGYFEYLIESPKAKQYLEDHPEFAEVLKKW